VVSLKKDGCNIQLIVELHQKMSPYICHALANSESVPQKDWLEIKYFIISLYKGAISFVEVT
jgi:hypothetical protein